MSFQATSSDRISPELSMSTIRRVFRPAWVIAIALTLVWGCGKTDTRARRVPVSGTVLYKGQPAAEATVLFDPVGNTPAATGKTDASGRYQLTTFDANDGAVPGEYKVVVRKVQVIPGSKPETASDDFAGLPPDEKWLLPTKYGHSESSGLTATVKENAANDFKFELQD
jgi:hypothetical protein